MPQDYHPVEGLDVADLIKHEELGRRRARCACGYPVSAMSVLRLGEMMLEHDRWHEVLSSQEGPRFNVQRLQAGP